MPTITQGIPIPRAATLPESFSEFAALIIEYSDLPSVTLQTVTIRDSDYPSGVTIDEDHLQWGDQYTCKFDGRIHITKKVLVGGDCYFEPHLIHAGLGQCPGCRNVVKSNLIKGRFCAGCIVMKLSAKTIPPGGWEISRVDSSDTSPTFGFELELEVMKASPGCRSPQSYAENIIRAVEGHPPMISTTDCSLTNGCEMVSHPMSYDYIVANNGIIASMFTGLREHFRAENEHGEHKASLHIHASKKMFVPDASNELLELLNGGWVTAHKDFLIALSGRPEESFKKWCMLPNYKYIGPRNQADTWECRGFSNHAVFDHGEEDGESFDASTDLPHLCNWIKAIAWMTHNESRFGLSPIDIMKLSGNESSVEWLSYFTGADKAVPELGYGRQHAKWKLDVNRYGSHMAGCLVQLRAGAVITVVGVPLPTGAVNLSRPGLAGRYCDGVISVSQSWNNSATIRYCTEAQNLEIVEGIPYDRLIPSLVFTPVVAEVI